MNAIEQFQKIDREYSYAKSWASLLGDSYAGGGGGIGKVVTASANLTIYHQHSNGAKNYHEVPFDSMQSAINAVALEMAPEIIKRALAKLAAERNLAAKSATEEANAVIAAANGEPE